MGFSAETMANVDAERERQARRETLKRLVGRRIAVLVMKGNNGLHSVVDWQAVPQSSAYAES